MLDDVVGVIVLSAGVGNDIVRLRYRLSNRALTLSNQVGWILLALTVALVNASSGVTAVYVLLVSVCGHCFLSGAV